MQRYIIKLIKGKQMKIVIPVDNDKKTIFKRTGKAPFFAIYEDNKMIQIVVNAHASSHHEEHHHHYGHSEEEVEHHRQDILNLKGCDVILAQAVGVNMKEALKDIGLEIQKIRKIDGESADEVIKKFLNGDLNKQKS